MSILYTDRILTEASATTGWNDDSKLDVLQTYIDNQKDDGAWRDHVLWCATEEAGLEEREIMEDWSVDEILDYLAWNTSSMIDIATSYIDRQDSEESFKDYVDGRVDEEAAIAASV